MSKYKNISEDDAQVLANLLGAWIVVNRDGSVYAYKIQPTQGKNGWYGFKRPFDRFCDTDYELPIRINSIRKWNEKIWEPINSN